MISFGTLSIYNMDETGVPLDTKPPKVHVEKIRKGLLSFIWEQMSDNCPGVW